MTAKLYTVTLPVQVRRCASCKAEIVWTETETGARMPLSWKTKQEVRQGLLGTSGRGELVGYSMESHFGDCPNAKQHSKKGKATA